MKTATIHFEIVESPMGFSIETGIEGNEDINLSFLLPIEEFAYETPHEAAYQCLKSLDRYGLACVYYPNGNRVFLLISSEFMALANIYAIGEKAN